MTNTELMKDLVKAQLEIKAPEKDKVNPRFKTKYCSLDAIYSSCRSALAKHGLTLSHSVELLDGKSVLVTTLNHISGESMSNKIPMFIENQTSQGFASALTYGRRYAICSLLGLPTEEDDDGEMATRDERGLNESQAQEIMSFIKEDANLMQRILKGYDVKSLREIPNTEFSKIIANLRARQ
jgi:hypothetical protein